MRGVESALLASWYALWDHAQATSVALRALVPGGLHFGPVPTAKADGTPIALPYARIEVETQGGPEWNSGGDYVQSFRVSVEVRSSAGATDAGSIQTALGAVYDPPSPGSTTPPNWSIVGPTRTLRVAPADSSLDTEPWRKAGQDVCLAVAAWDVTLQLPR